MDAPAVTEPPKKRKPLAKSSTPSFVLTLPLATTQADERALRIKLDAGRQIYNAALGEALRRLDCMRESRAWRAACALPKTDGFDRYGKPRRNKARDEVFKALRERFGFSWPSVIRLTQDCRNRSGWIAGHLGSQEAQALTKRAFSVVEQYSFGKRGRPRCRGKAFFDSVENQCATCGLRFDGAALVWGSLRILPIFDGGIYEASALACRTKYARVVRRELRGVERWYLQLIQEGQPPQRREYGEGTVGLDIGPSTIAAVSDDDATLERFCPSVEQPWRELRVIERAMDRARRGKNPHAFDEKGCYIRGAKLSRSRRYQKLALKRRERERRLAAERKRSHGELANRVLGQGTDVRTEKLSYKGWQRGLFGRSLKVRAPGAFVAMLKRKLDAAPGGSLIEINTRKTALSQFDHTTGAYVKKPLSQRTHHFGDGKTAPVHRDLYSAFLARHCGPDTLDACHAIEAWPGAEQHLRRAASRSSQSASGQGFALPRAVLTGDAGADRASSAENRPVEAAHVVVERRGARRDGSGLHPRRGKADGESLCLAAP